MAIRLYSGWNTLAYTFPSAGEMAAGWGGGMEAMTEDFRFRSNLQDKRHSPGGFNTGDNFLESRRIQIAGVIEGPTRAETAMEINDMKNACYRGNHNWENTLLQITQYSTAPHNQLYRVSGASRFIVDWISPTAAEVLVVFDLADPFRYDRGVTRQPAWGELGANRVFNSGNDFTATLDINVPEDVAYVQLPQLLVSVGGGSLGRLWYWNTTNRRPGTGGWSGMRLDALNLRADQYQKSLLVDSENSTVERCEADDDGGNIRDKIDHIHKMAFGDFPWLHPGQNTLRFTAQALQPGAEFSLRFWVSCRYRYL